MFRVDDPTAAASLPAPEAAGTEGYFTEGNPGGGVPATAIRGSWANRVQESLRAIVDAVGIVPGKTAYSAISQAIRRMAGANTSVLTTTGALTTDQAGVVSISAAAGNVTRTLPAANAANGVPIRFDLVRTDSSANTLTIQRAGADTIEGGTTRLVGVGDRLRLVSDGVSAWRVLGGSGGALLATSGWQRLPSGLIIQWGTFGGTTGTLGGTGIAEVAGIVTNFPIPFPTACWSVSLTANDVTGAQLHEQAANAGFNATNFTASLSCRQATTAMTGNFMAIGS